MFGIIISGHGHYASGVYSSMQLILGEQEKVAIVDFPQTDTTYRFMCYCKVFVSVWYGNAVLFSIICHGFMGTVFLQLFGLSLF